MPSLPSSVSLAEGLALNRVAFGAGLLLAPELNARTWVGAKAARRSGTKVFAQALGARDLVLGAGGLMALRAGDTDRARQWFAAQGVTDAVDLLATLRARSAVRVTRLRVDRGGRLRGDRRVLRCVGVTRALHGLAAGAVGTLFLNAATYLDMAVRGRPASPIPEADASDRCRSAVRTIA